MTSSAANNSAAIAAAINGADDNLIEVALQRSRQSISLKYGETRGAENTSFGQETISTDDAKPMASLVDHEDEPSAENDYAIEGSMIIDRHTNFENGGSSKARVRRASEGAHHSRREGKRASGEVRCEKCGKGYKHSSCLTKHLLVHPSLRLYTLSPWCSHLKSLKICKSNFHRNRLHILALINTDIGGNIRPNGHIPQSFSSLSINKFSCLRRLPSLLE